MFLFLVLISCHPKDITNDQPNIDNLSSNRMWDVPQSDDEWWNEPSEDSSSYAGAGLLIEDINQDGQLDLVLLRRNGVRLLLQNTNGWEEQELPQVEGVGANGSIVDFDQDGDLDIVLNMQWGSDVLLHQEDTEWTVQSLPSAYHSSASAWYDINKDGLLDLTLAGYGDDDNDDFNDSFDANIPYPGEQNRIFLQTSEHELIETELISGILMETFTFNLTWLPINDDPYWDLFSVNDFGFLNGGHQIFWNQNGESLQRSEIPLTIEAEMFGMGLAVADINHDQTLDISITNIGSITSFISNADDWYDSALNFGFGATDERHTSWGIDWGDVNNDGHLDLWIGYGPLPINGDASLFNPSNQPDALFLWTADGYQDVSLEWGLNRRTNTRAGGFVDLNRDGCLELVRISLDGPVEIFTGECHGNWITIRLDDGNHGIGSQVTIIGEDLSLTEWMVAGGTSFATFFPLEIHYGLGVESNVDIRVTWPDGTEQFLESVTTNQYLVITKE